MGEKWQHALVAITLVFYLCICQSASPDGVQCIDDYKCVPVSKCRTEDLEGGFMYPCHQGLNLICCRPQDAANDAAHLVNRKTSLFPENCGVVVTANKISGGKMADLGQFPWMALLGYKQRQVEFVQFLCGGSIITDRYVLTAAHCLHLERRLELVLVRLGEQNLSTEVDCIELQLTKECADRYVENPVEQIIPHPGFNRVSLKNDIALIKVRRKIAFSDYIKPICLPFERNLETRNLTRQKFTISGWGKTSSRNLGGSTTLQYTVVTVWNPETCGVNVPPSVKPIQDTQLCANGNATEDACKGDSGGPLVNATVDADGELRYFQVGIVSFASTITCGNPSLPTIYTRVDKYLSWIIDTIS